MPAAGRTWHTILRPPTSTWAKLSLTATLTFRTHLQVYQIPLVSSLVLCALTDLVIPGWSVNVFWCYTSDPCLVPDANTKWEVQFWGLASFGYSCYLTNKKYSTWLLQVNYEDLVLHYLLISLMWVARRSARCLAPPVHDDKMVGPFGVLAIRFPRPELDDLASNTSSSRTCH
jgi:hypothetical protein